MAPVPLDARVRDVPWAAVDLEMTGLDTDADRICEIGVVRGRRGGVEERWSSLVTPGVPMSPGAFRVHGIEDAELDGAPGFGEVVDELAARLGDALCIAHRVDVDRRFLTAAFERVERTWPDGVWVDTLAIARRLLLLPSHRLGDLCVAFGLPDRPEHRALGDAEAAWMLWSCLLDLLDPEEDLTVGGLLELVDGLAMGSRFRRAQMDLLEEAVRRRRSVVIRYVSRDDDGVLALSEREVAVWRIRPPRVQGFCHLRGEERVFRVERIRSVALGERRYTIPEHRPRI